MKFLLTNCARLQIAPSTSIKSYAVEAQSLAII